MGDEIAGCWGVLAGYWFPQPTGALALALRGTPLIIIGHWLSIPQNAPEWQSWLNRAISLGDIWLVAAFVWRIRILRQELQQQVDIANDQVSEIRDLTSTLEQRVEDRTAEVMQRSRELDEKNRQLSQANEELTAVYDQGLFASQLNTEGRIVHANRACIEDLGFARADIIGKLFWEAGWWYNLEARKWIRKAFEQAIAGTPFRGELSYVFNRDGAERVTDIAFIPIKDQAGRVTSVFVLGTDITGRARQYRATFETRRSALHTSALNFAGHGPTGRSALLSAGRSLNSSTSHCEKSATRTISRTRRCKSSGCSGARSTVINWINDTSGGTARPPGEG